VIENARATALLAGQSQCNPGMRPGTRHFSLEHLDTRVKLPGTGKIERIGKAVEAGQIRLSREQWFMIRSVSTGREAPQRVPEKGG